MKLLLALAGLLTLVGLVWLAISVGDATERGRVHETPVVTPIGVLTPADAAREPQLAAPPSTQPPVQPKASAEPRVDPEPSTGGHAPAATASARARAYVPPDPARFAEKYRDIDGPTAAQRAGQLRNRLEQHAASALSSVYHEEGRYSVWPYTYDARGERQPAESSIPPAELEPIHRIYDAPDEQAWHLVVVTPAERPDLYDLRWESKWLGSRGRAGDE